MLPVNDAWCSACMRRVYVGGGGVDGDGDGDKREEGRDSFVSSVALSCGAN